MYSLPVLIATTNEEDLLLLVRTIIALQSCPGETVIADQNPHPGGDAPTVPHVLHVVPLGGTGGVQTHVADLCIGLVRRAFRVTVAAGTEGAMVRRLRDAGVPTVLVPMRRRSDLPAMRQILRVIRDEGVDLVHTHSPLGGVLGRHAALRAGRPMVHTLHGLGVLDELRRPQGIVHVVKLLTYRWHERRLNTRTNALIAPSPTVAAAATAAGHVPPARLYVIPHGVDVGEVTERGDTATVLYVGRLHPEKGVDGLIKAFGMVHDQEPRATLVLVGDGPMRARLQRQVTDAKLTGVVRFAGETDGTAAAMRGAAFVVLPSQTEGLSYALLEAMAHGVPCVATAVGGTPDLIEHGRTGILVAAGDLQQLRDAILMLLRDPDRARRLGAAAREVVRTRFSRESMITRTGDLYHAVLRQRNQ